MERVDWLKKVRAQTESLYDHIAPEYWVQFGFYANETHRQFIEKFLERLSPHSSILDAACGAGRYDGILLEAGHNVLGTDQSGGMLDRAREVFPEERFPTLRYSKMGLQELDFQAQFDGVICIDTMEHIFPEDWPGIMVRFQKALKHGGMLYLTLETVEPSEVREAYERAKAMGLPVILGELGDKIDAAYNQLVAQDWQGISGELAGSAAYHYYPSEEKVRTWHEQAGLVIEVEGSGDGYAHFLSRRAN